MTVKTNCADPCIENTAEPLDTNGRPPVNLPTETTSAVTHTVVSAAGTVAAGMAGVSVTNTGDAPGVFQGSIIAVGQAVSLNAYYDNATHEFVRLPQLSYDGTGTTLSIVTQD